MLPTALLRGILAEIDALLAELRGADARLREQNVALHGAYNQITAERERYVELFEYAPDAYCVTDAAGIVCEANRTVAQLLGVRPSDLIGKPLIHYAHSEDRPTLRQKLISLQVEDAPAQIVEHVRLTPLRGESFEADLLICLPGNRPDSRFVKVVRDITHRKQAEQAFWQSHEALENRVRARTAELANANATLQTEVADQKRTEDRRKQILRQWVKALEEERRRISRELHDEMGQRLAAFSLGLRALEESYPNNERALPLLDQMRVQVSELGREVHRMAVALRPTALDDLGLVSVLQGYVEAWAERTGTAADFEASGLKQRLPSETETALYRIAQEALNNVAKHARASRVGVMLYRHEGDVVLAVEDNGCGFNAEDAGASSAQERRSGGLGMVGMRERVSMIGGTLAIESEVEQGTTLLVRVPAPAEFTKEDLAMNVPMELPTELTDEDTDEDTGIAKEREDSVIPITLD